MSSNTLAFKQCCWNYTNYCEYCQCQYIYQTIFNSNKLVNTYCYQRSIAIQKQPKGKLKQVRELNVFIFVFSQNLTICYSQKSLFRMVFILEDLYSKCSLFWNKFISDGLYGVLRQTREHLLSNITMLTRAYILVEHADCV